MTLRGYACYLAAILAGVASSCTRKVDEERRSAGNNEPVTQSPMLCLETSELNRLESGHPTHVELWKIVHHYDVCEDTPIKSEPWLKRLVKMGDTTAMIELGSEYEYEGRREEAVAITRMAVRAGDVSAQRRLESMIIEQNRK